MHNGCTNRTNHGLFLMPILIKEYIKRILASSSWHCPLELFKPPCHNSCDKKITKTPWHTKENCLHYIAL